MRTSSSSTRTYVKRDPELAEYAAPSFTAGRPFLDAVLDLTHRIFTEFRFDSDATTIATPLREVLERAAGASARISPTWRSAACARSAWPRVTSAATS